MPLLRRFHKSLIISGSIPVGSRVLVAVSGGADSVALLFLLHDLSEEMDLYLEVAHLDHALRKSSRDDASFVEEFCVRLGIPVTLERRDVGSLAAQKRGNLEEVARDVRRQFLLSTAKLHRCNLIALGHHADDQAETFLMRLLRGAGSTGLAGMRQIAKPFVRPLLTFKRSELLAYLEARGLSWREDESNLDHGFTRNRIRHELLPVLESYNPNVSEQLAGLCEQMRRDDEFWSVLVSRELERCGEWLGGCYSLDLLLVRALHPALAGRLIRAALKEVRGNLRGLTAVHIADVMALLSSGPPQGELCLPGAWVARRYEKLMLCREKPASKAPFCCMLSAPGVFLLPEGLALRVSLEERSLGENSSAVEFSADALSFPLHVRCCEPGDRFRPSGMNGTKKLQDLFVDLKLTKEERQGALLLESEGDVVWVVGLRRAEGRRPLEGKPVLRIVVGSQMEL